MDDCWAARKTWAWGRCDSIEILPQASFMHAQTICFNYHSHLRDLPTLQLAAKQAEGPANTIQPTMSCQARKKHLQCSNQVQREPTRSSNLLLENDSFHDTGITSKDIPLATQPSFCSPKRFTTRTPHLQACAPTLGRCNTSLPSFPLGFTLLASPCLL